LRAETSDISAITNSPFRKIRHSRMKISSM